MVLVKMLDIQLLSVAGSRRHGKVVVVAPWQLRVNLHQLSKDSLGMVQEGRLQYLQVAMKDLSHLVEMNQETLWEEQGCDSKVV